jgi:hypothetical protein
VQQVTCVGAAVPVPDWSAYAQNPASIPTQCADGTTGGVFANTRRIATLFASDFKAPRSVRSNVNWNGPVLGNRFNATVDLTYSLNLNQASTLDLNFQPTQRSRCRRGGRPVYAQREHRPRHGRDRVARRAGVTALQPREPAAERSAQREQAAAVGIFPASFTQRFSWSLNYTLADVREQYRGFQSTSGNPLDVAWSRAAGESRHQFTYTARLQLLRRRARQLVRSVQSGPRSPPSSRATSTATAGRTTARSCSIPARASDPAVASAMRSLLETGSGPGERVSREAGRRIASRNSCRGPWTSNANLSISLNPMKVRMPQRATLSFSVSNPLGAADLLLHGENNLKGWGSSPSSIPRCSTCAASTRRRSATSTRSIPRFGSTNPQFNSFRAPVTLTMQVRVDVGPTRERQQLTQQLDRGRKRQGQKTPSSC